MRTDPDTIRLHNNRITGTDSIFPRFGHSIHRIEYILSVTIDNLQVLEAREVFGYFTVGSLFRFGYGNTIPIILYYKNHRKTFEAGTIDSFVNESFGSSRLSVRSDSYAFMSIIYHCSGHTCCVKVVCTSSRGDVFNVPFRFGEMVRHVTSSATRVRCFGNTVQDNFFSGHSGGKHG